MLRRLTLCFVLTACARGGPTPDVTVSPVTARIMSSTGTGINLTRNVETVGIPVSVMAAPDAVFATLLAVYKDLGVPTTRVETARRLAGNDLFRMRRKLGGVAMQTYVDCGGGLGEPNAETFDMELGLVSYVRAAELGSTITTTLTASGSDPRFGRDRLMRCTSKGELEQRIPRMVREKLGVK